MTLLCRLGIHTRGRYLEINTAGRYTLRCKRCGKELV